MIHIYTVEQKSGVLHPRLKLLTKNGCSQRELVLEITFIQGTYIKIESESNCNTLQNLILLKYL